MENNNESGLKIDCAKSDETSVGCSSEFAKEVLKSSSWGGIIPLDIPLFILYTRSTREIPCCRLEREMDARKRVFSVATSQSLQRAFESL